MPARPFAWAARCFCRLRHFPTASSSRQNCSETNLPAVVMLSKRSSEMNPSAFSRSACSPATRSMYSGNLPAAGVNSKMTAITDASFARDYSLLASRGETRLRASLRRGQPSLRRLQLRELDLAADASGDYAALVGQFEAHAEGAARGVEHAVDDLDRRGVLPAQPFWSDFARHAQAEPAVVLDGQHYLDAQRIDLRELDDRLGLGAVLRQVAGIEHAVHHHPVEGAAQGAQVQQVDRMAVVEPGEVLVLARILQLRLRDAHLGLHVVVCLHGDEILLLQLLCAAQLRRGILETLLRGGDAPGHFRAELRGLHRRALGARFQLDQDLARLCRIAALDVDLADQTFHGAADLHDLIRLDQALERSRASAQRRRERRCRHESL